MNSIAVILLVAQFILIGGCAGTLTEDEIYERGDAYAIIVSDYKRISKRCRARGGSLVSSGSYMRNVSGKLTVEQMQSARCVSRH